VVRIPLCLLLQIYGDGASETLDKIEPDFLRARALSPLPIPLTAFMAERLLGAGHADEALDVIASMIAELRNPHIGLTFPSFIACGRKHYMSWSVKMQREPRETRRLGLRAPKVPVC
jgi:hypothetical protein